MFLDSLMHWSTNFACAWSLTGTQPRDPCSAQCLYYTSPSSPRALCAHFLPMTTSLCLPFLLHSAVWLCLCFPNQKVEAGSLLGSYGELSNWSLVLRQVNGRLVSACGCLALMPIWMLQRQKLRMINDTKSHFKASDYSVSPPSLVCSPSYLIATKYDKELMPRSL